MVSLCHTDPLSGPERRQENLGEEMENLLREAWNSGCWAGQKGGRIKEKTNTGL